MWNPPILKRPRYSSLSMAVTETERFSLAVLNFWKVKNMVVRMAMREYVTYWKGYCDIFEKKNCETNFAILLTIC